MSGHSKWHNIQARKGKQDAKRSNVFSMYSKKISIAAKAGGGDPATNFSLRILIEKARDAGMPKDNIERAVKRGTGADGEGVQIEECTYEGYGPGGVAILVKALTDNKNRTVSELKHVLSQYGGSMGGAGSVAWMFSEWGVIEIDKQKLPEKNLNEDEFQMNLIEAGAEDISDDNGVVVVKTKMENLQKVVSKVKEMGIEPNESGLQWIAKDKVPVAEEVRGKLESLFSALDENEDIDDYFTNAD